MVKSKLSLNFGTKLNFLLTLALTSLALLAVPARAKLCTKAVADLLGESTPKSTKPRKTPPIQKAAAPAGFVVGAANDVLVSCLQCSSGAVLSALGPWLPLTNEMTNVLSTATGKKWIYSGVSKSLADGVALGAIVGHSLSAGIQHGPVAGGLTLVADLGITYWFPNKYFHGILRGIPKMIPERLGKLQRIADSPVGQGVIGISMIFALEQILSKAESLAASAPDFFGQTPRNSKKDDPVVQARKANAACLMEDLLTDGKTENEQLLQFVTGATHAELFSTFVTPTTEGLKSITPAPAELLRLRSLSPSFLQQKFGGLLSPEEIEAMAQRVSLLSSQAPSTTPNAH